MDILFFIVCGCCAGIIAGLLGLGGGIIVVPALNWYLQSKTGYADHAMHLAIATALAIMVPTALMSSYAHYRHGSLNSPMLQSIIPWLIIGAIIGVLSALKAQSSHLMIVFGVLATLLVYKTFRRKPISTQRWTPPLPPVMGFIGFWSVITGTGGGTLTVPYLILRGELARVAVGTSAACGFVIGIVSVCGFLVTSAPIGLAQTIGYVYWPAFFGIGISAMLCAPLGAKLSHQIQVRRLELILAAVLSVVAIKMFVDAFS
ncbi:MAG: sulfite exporter TauE/SafE family protein [Gammaproteobacteria bacterium]|nr:sulfite exporter TauE/SafE family protein [Gammaproteobacteria bacterium]MDH5727984.1 sulfite exporter TauE/SafE family protein [Gammaproteobacteria bacterium]